MSFESDITFIRNPEIWNNKEFPQIKLEFEEIDRDTNKWKEEIDECQN